MIVLVKLLSLHKMRRWTKGFCCGNEVRSALEFQYGKELFAGLLRDFLVGIGLVQPDCLFQAIKICRAVRAIGKVALDFAAFC
jgi:hypothetical protein